MIAEVADLAEESGSKKGQILPQEPKKTMRIKQKKMTRCHEGTVNLSQETNPRTEQQAATPKSQQEKARKLLLKNSADLFLPEHKKPERDGRYARPRVLEVRREGEAAAGGGYRKSARRKCWRTERGSAARGCSYREGNFAGKGLSAARAVLIFSPLFLFPLSLGCFCEIPHVE